MRLDKYLVLQKIVNTREKAKFLISQGFINVNNTQIKKASFNVKEDDKVEALNEELFVSRSGIKLDDALEKFNMDVGNFVCLDIGSSTGGFTDCLLKRGVLKVYAVDVGTDQLDKNLLNNSKVISFENTDIRNFDPKSIKEPLDLIVVDVSFISIKEIIKILHKFCISKTRIIVLLKPQFEVGKGNLKKGIVKNPEIIEKVLHDIKSFVEEFKFTVKETIKSKLKGKEGNQEYLLLVFPR